MKKAVSNFIFDIQEVALTWGVFAFSFVYVT